MTKKQATAAIFIPARMASTRFPGKPLADINGQPMIAHVVQRSLNANVGDVYVACCEDEVQQAATAAGAVAIMTKEEHPSGTDRIFEAFQKSGKDYDYIINVQGDLPNVNAASIKTALNILLENKADISTLAAAIKDEEERDNPNVVKAVIALNSNGNIGKALYFTRATAPYGEGPLYHHIGLYAYRREALEKFIKLPPSTLEKREKLEQLRALENNMSIYVGIVNTIPLGVDTKEDLLKVTKQLMK